MFGRRKSWLALGIKVKETRKGRNLGLYGVQSREVARVAARSWMARSVEWRYAEVDEAR